MTATQGIPEQAARVLPFRTRLPIYAVSGAIVGLFFFAPASLLLQLAIRHGHPPWREFLDFWSPLGDNFWRFVMERSKVFMEGPFSGLIGGAITSVFSTRMRHPLALASLWASFLATPMLVMFFLLEPRVIDAVMMVAWCVALGATYGFLLGLLARLVERWLERIKRRRAGQTVPRGALSDAKGNRIE